ncbi:precorrin-6Y C5,15-methyltransferase (decarboxylating) subunit CbiT [Halanaerobium hydrogeniformans]|uniref:Precorrin-6Y C5,15-methyltransferase (Decarboxylating), CbiT subunit n=1 Tax=Halanaerobium hydrogeniformans TaxID=656519 RepID=E4RK99_HALHG|nr:precorrin-6Y C5,15-methyltransferase (decarboxylating) subunit CbiT [Halanaerobium hydrogeniformans]ADQ15612.1 precorrin-6Y C5,15-methyltransferase (decarboxylating), CbiT subunit [Halanaerobium hydrogeniformans]
MSEWKYITAGIPDKDFVRGEVPMTKEEIRAVVISKLRLQKNHIVYDIGAGSGSITVEVALKARTGMIYAVEKKAKAVDLIKKNCNKFKLNNVKIIEKEAPQGFEELPPADRIFIGGSGGFLKEIISHSDKNLKKDGKIILTAITVNTLSTAVSQFEQLNYQIDISNVSVTKTNKVGDYHMFKALNPVYIISAQKEEE